MALSPYVAVVRTALLLLHALSFYFCTVVATCAAPPSENERKIRDRARLRFGSALEATTKALQHLTVCSNGMLCGYLVLALGGWDGPAAAVAVVVMPLETVVGVLFWSALPFRRALVAKDSG